MSMNQRALEHKWHFPALTLAALAQISIDLGVKVNRLHDLDHPFLKIRLKKTMEAILRWATLSPELEMVQVAEEHEKMTLHSVWLAGSLRK